MWDSPSLPQRQPGPLYFMSEDWTRGREFGLVAWITFHSMWGKLSPRRCCCRHQLRREKFPPDKQTKAVCSNSNAHQMFETEPITAAKFGQSWLDRVGVSYFSLWATGSHSLFAQELRTFPQHSALCPLTDTNTNIIPTRGGNSFLTWMIKIF